MTGVQSRSDNNTVPFFRYGIAATENDGDIAQDGSRTVDLVRFTVMAKVSATQLWTPFINAAATDGTAIPQGIYVGNDIASADIVAGNVPDSNMLVGSNIFVDVNQLTIENSLTLNTVITVGTTDLRTVKDHLANRGIFTEDTIDIASFENA